MNTLKLYEISNEYASACDHLFDEELELPENAIQNTLDGLQGMFEEKSLNVAAYYKNVEAQIKTMKDYEENMHKRRKALEKRNQNLKNYLLFNMQKCNIKKISGPEFEVKIRTGGDRVVIDNDSDIPDEYVKVRTEVSPDKNKIKEDLQKGLDVNGCHLELSESIIIK